MLDLVLISCNLANKLHLRPQRAAPLQHTMPSSQPNSPQGDSSPEDAVDQEDLDDGASEVEIVRLRRRQRRRFRFTRGQLMAGFFAFFALLIFISAAWYMYQRSGY